MHKTFTSARQIAVAAVAAASLIFSAGAMAAKPEGKIIPGKPGQNAIVENGTIVDIAIAVNGLLGEFDYLLGAVGCLTDDEGNNAVVDLLSGSDKYTLFAPNDAAFEALQRALGISEPAPELTCAVDDIFGAGTLFTVLAYHVTDGRRFSNSVFNANSPKEIEMLGGGYITTTPDRSIIDGVPQVIGLVPPFVNINASNGVVHVIDTVMLPFNPFE
jgi:transforming growth factor-beta-induced protein